MIVELENSSKKLKNFVYCNREIEVVTSTFKKLRNI